jgi:hypothetical protein
MSSSESREINSFAKSLGLRKAGNSGKYTYVAGITEQDIAAMLEAYKTNEPLEDRELKKKYVILLLHRYNENIMTSRIGLSKKGQYDPVNRRILEAISGILGMPITNVEQLREEIPMYDSIFREYANGQQTNNRTARSSFVEEPTPTPRRSARVSAQTRQVQSPAVSFSPRQPRRQAQQSTAIPQARRLPPSPISSASSFTGASNTSPPAFFPPSPSQTRR